MVTGLFRHRRPCSAAMQRTGMMVVVVLVMMVGMMMESVGGAAMETAERPSRTKRSEAETTAEWSVWFNSDTPAEGDGDFETIDSVSRTHGICSPYHDVVKTQCRVAGTNDSFDSSTTAFLEDRLLQACSRLGLICLNAQQTSGRRCHDYEVRFLCQGSDVDGGGDSLFPNLDFKIYILLAAVPLMVIILRLLWSCWWKPRLKQRRLLRRQQQQHRGSLASGGTLSSSSSQASIDSSLANPPPAYTELFGDGRPAVFSISGRECAGCGKCLHRNGFVQEGMVEVSVEGDGRGTVVAAVASAAPLPPSLQDVPPPELDEVFEADPSQDSDGTGRSQTVSRPARSVRRHSSPSSASLQGAEAPAPPPPPPFELTPSASPAPVQCTCSCHQLPPSGYVNLAFRRDSSTQVDSPPPPPPPPPPMYPGMHKPVFPFARIGSVTSFTSLPDYEEALEILKKNGLFLDEEKV